MFERDAAALSAALREAAHAVIDIAQGVPGQQPAEQQPDPTLLAIALEQLADVLKRAETSNTDPGLSQEDIREDIREDISRWGDYGLGLLGDLTTWAEMLRLPSGTVDMATVSFALWVAEHGGRLNVIEPVVNALASIANTTRDNQVLGELTGLMGILLEAVHPVIQHDLEKTNPGRPWRVLNLNRAIVATRSHKAETMEAAFQTLIRNLPEEAPAFFREGMRQMEALDYPPQVREVMQGYFQRWSAPKLH